MAWWEPQGASESVSEDGLYLAAKSPAQAQLGPALEVHAVIAVKQRREMGDLVDADDRGSVDTHEFGRVEILGHGPHRTADQVSLPLAVEPHVVAGPFDPLDVARGQKDDHRVALDGKPLDVCRCPAHVTQVCRWFGQRILLSRM